MFDRLLDRVAVAEIGQQPGKLDIPLELALEEDAVEVEDDCVRHQSSNNAVPTRTAVAPSITAASKSLDIPMLKPVTSWRRASFARSAKKGAGSGPSGGIAISPASGSGDVRTAATNSPISLIGHPPFCSSS